MSAGPSQRRPSVVVVTGEPGSGKTSLGRLLSGALRVPFLSRDDVRGGLLATAGLWTNEGRLAPRREEAVEVFVQIVEKLAVLGVSVVVEFVVLPDRLEAFERIVAVADCVVIRTTCTNAAARADRRDRADPFLNRREVLDALGHESIDDYVAAPQRRIVRDGIKTDFELPVLDVRTDEGYDAALPEMVDWIIDQRVRNTSWP